MAKNAAKGFSPLVEFARENSGPLHFQITECIRQSVHNGRILPGARLASTRVLAADWGVSRNTVLQVFETLLSEGIIVSRVGDGTYVSDNPEASARYGASDGVSRGDRTVSYPFRGLSRRGRVAVATPSYGQAEKPVPFMPNVPDFSAFPTRSWLRLMNEVSGGLTGNTLSEFTDAGYFPLREAIARHIAISRGHLVKPEQVITTTGSQQGLDLVVRLLTDPGDPAWMEDPGYPGTFAALSANAANIRFVPVDGDGMRVDDAVANEIVPRLICVSPARQFPTGAVLSATRARTLLDFAARSGSWILEDDFDSEFHYVAPPPVSLAAQDAGKRVILMGTFSTTLLPSLRMGYLIVPEDLIPHFSHARSISHGHISLLEQLVLAEMMNRGIYAAHLRRMRTLYRPRQQTLVAALRKVLKYNVPAHERQSGLHVLLPLIDSVNDERVCQMLAQRGVAARPLSSCYHARKKEQGLLLGFAPFDDANMIDAATRLDQLTEMIDRRPTETRFADRTASIA